MGETARESIAMATGLRPSCHRCGTPLADSPDAPCPRCIECPRRPVGMRLRDRSRLRLRTLLVLVAVGTVAVSWGIHAWRRLLTDDSGQFDTHQERARYHAFLKAVALSQAHEAE